MTCNQLILLLACYRGTISQELKMETFIDDLAHLKLKGLIDAKYELTTRGHNYIEEILTYSKDIP